MSLESIEAKIAAIADRLNMPPPAPRPPRAPVSLGPNSTPISTLPATTGAAVARETNTTQINPLKSENSEVSFATGNEGGGWVSWLVSGSKGTYLKWFILLAAGLCAFVLFRWSINYLKGKMKRKSKETDAESKAKVKAEVESSRPMAVPASTQAPPETIKQPEPNQVPQAPKVQPTSLEELLKLKESAKAARVITPRVELIEENPLPEASEEDLDPPPSLVDENDE